MKALILLATLKSSGLSNTETLVEFFTGKMEEAQVQCEVVKLVNENILPGTYSNMGDDDAWPAILEKIEASEIIVLATPIWWGNHSSVLQKVIERLDEIHDEILAGKPSRLDNKVAGIIITGDSDGAEHIIGSISNFLNAVGVILPPYATLAVLWDGQKKDADTSREKLMEEYTKNYSKTAGEMVKQLVKFAAKKEE
jgi:multimeric flavodoxin WrbA